MILAGSQQINRHVELAQIDLLATHAVSLPGTRRLFSRYMLRMYQAANGPGRLVESEFQYSRSKPAASALQVIARDVFQTRSLARRKEKVFCRSRAGNRPPCRSWLRACRHRFIDEQADFAGIGKIEQRGQQGQRGNRRLAARLQYRQRRRQDGAADAESWALTCLTW